MIKLLAPTTVESADEDTTVIIEMDADVFRALAAAVDVALDDPQNATGYVEQAEELWTFFHPLERAAS